MPAHMPVASGHVNKCIDAVLRAAREFLGMDVAFLAEFLEDDMRLFRNVDAGSPRAPVQAGDRVSLQEGYCRRVVSGELPELIVDTSALPAAMAIPETRTIPIGSHLSVPVRLSSGQVFGTFCCFSHVPVPSLGPRDLQMMHTLADLVGHQIDTEQEDLNRRQALADRIGELIRAGQPDMIYQPIYALGGDWTLSGVECLARFQSEPYRSPDVWFNEASAVGQGPRLEIAAIRNALAPLAEMPGEFYVAVNCSPETVLCAELAEAVAAIPPERLVIEITEHAHVDDYQQLAGALQAFRQRGVRIAIDDAGAGFASMRHILNLQPDLIKLDISLTRSINTDARRKALAGALVEFARHTDSMIIAEGVETPGELAALHALGVKRAQGYFMSEPLRLPELMPMLGSRG